MISIGQDAWAKLGKCPDGEKLVARPALPEITQRLLCALDSANHRHLLIPLEPTDADYADVQSRGIRALTKELAVRGLKPERYLDMECLDASGYPAFDIIGGEIADDLKAGGKSPSEIVRRVLAKWRRFWGQLPQQLLSKEEQIGLFAELWFLSVWLLPKFGTEIVLTWRGPWASRHDFEWPDKSVEVKATTSTRGRVHKIHGITQLEEPATGPLFLFSVCLREEAGAIDSLPGLIENCRKQIGGSDDALTRFESALVKSGYSPLFQDEYAKLKLRVIEGALFRVNNDFPKITTTSFPSGIPSGIEQIDYEINLNSFDNLIVSNNPDTYQLK